MDINFTPPTIKSTEVYKGKRITVRVDEVDCNLDSLVKREVIEHPGAVVILPLTDDNKIVLVNQYRHALGHTTLELPAGTREKGEDALETAKRELSEEAKYAAREWQSLGTLHPLPGLSNELQYLYLARSLYEKHKDADPGEFIEIKKVSIEEMKVLITNNTITDAKTISAVCRALFLNLI